MDAFLKLMMADTTIVGIGIQNWMLAFAGVVVIWTAVIVRDL